MENEKNFYQETIVIEETATRILAGYSYKLNNDEIIRSLFIDGEEYFIFSDVYNFCNRGRGVRHDYIREELRENELSKVLTKWELLQGGIDIEATNKTMTNKRGIVEIISKLDFPDESRINFVKKEILDTDNKPETPITNQVKYMVLPISVINFDTTYQRRVSMQKVRAIAQRFDMRVVGALIVSKRENGYYLVDGQHRVKAMELKGVRTVMCAVHENLTIPEEADLFWKCNNHRKQPTALDNFRASILAGDKDNIRIYELCTEVGYRINLNREDNKAGFYMLTVSGLITAFKLYGEDILEKTLRVLYAANVQKPSSIEIHGLSLFLKRYDDMGFNLSELSEKIGRNSQVELLSKARTMSEAIGGHTSTNYARVILGIYNLGKKNRVEDRFANLK